LVTLLKRPTARLKTAAYLDLGCAIGGLAINVMAVGPRP
jgi:hypothetical protein